MNGHRLVYLADTSGNDESRGTDRYHAAVADQYGNLWAACHSATPLQDPDLFPGQRVDGVRDDLCRRPACQRASA